MFYIVIKEKFHIKNIYKIYKSYKLITTQNLFDEEYYLKNYLEVKNSKLSPLDHYIYQGYKEGKKPSEKFDGNYYLESHKDVKATSINPLIHYVLYGQSEGRWFNKKTEIEKFPQYSYRLDDDNKKSIKSITLFPKKHIILEKT